MYFWRLWLRHRWHSITAACMALIAALFAWHLVTRSATLDLIALGNARAPRPAARVPASRLSHQGRDMVDRRAESDISHDTLLDRALDGSAGPRTVADARSSWSAPVLAKHQDAVLAAFNCARQTHGLPALALDPALSRTAGAAWLTLTHNHAWSVINLPGQYDLRGVIALDFTARDSACAVGGVDTTTLPTSGGATRIGIAVFPPQASWDMASAVVLVQ